MPSPTLKKGDKNKASAAVSVKKTDSNPPLPGDKRKDRSSSVLEKHNMIAFVIGLVISALVILVLIVPALNEDKDAKIKELRELRRMADELADTGGGSGNADRTAKAAKGKQAAAQRGK